jgi:hypothetical protein
VEVIRVQTTKDSVRHLGNRGFIRKRSNRRGCPTESEASNPKAAVTQKSQDKLALAEPELVQLLLLMETNKNGKISKQEGMKFMETEVDDWIRTTAEIWTPRT